MILLGQGQIKPPVFMYPEKISDMKNIANLSADSGVSPEESIQIY